MKAFMYSNNNKKLLSIIIRHLDKNNVDFVYTSPFQLFHEIEIDSYLDLKYKKAEKSIKSHVSESKLNSEKNFFNSIANLVPQIEYEDKSIEIYDNQVDVTYRFRITNNSEPILFFCNPGMMRLISYEVVLKDDFLLLKDSFLNKDTPDKIKQLILEKRLEFEQYFGQFHKTLQNKLTLLLPKYIVQLEQVYDMSKRHDELKNYLK